MARRARDTALRVNLHRKQKNADRHTCHGKRRGKQNDGHPIVLGHWPTRRFLGETVRPGSSQIVDVDQMLSAPRQEVPSRDIGVRRRKCLNRVFFDY